MLICFNALSQDIKCDGEFSNALFSEGPSELDSFITDNFIIPKDALINGVKATIRISFTLDSLNHVTDINVISPVELESYGVYETKPGAFDSLRLRFEQEARRVIQFSEGLWLPATCSGIMISTTVKKEIIIVPENYNRRDKDSRMPHRYGSDAWGGMFDDITPETPEKYYNNGVKKLTQKKYSLAIKYFREAIKRRRKYVDAYYNLGIAEIKLNHLEAACAAWQLAADYGDTESGELMRKFCK
jgi:tetratricopeptide (TPR) repeat protein